MDWILAALDSFDKQLIINSFKHCTLTVLTNGNEDQLIHCLKPNQPCTAGLDCLQGLHNEVLQETEDPFQGPTQSDEKELLRIFTTLDMDEDEGEIKIDT